MTRESATVRRLVRADELALITITQVADRPGVAAGLFRALADASIQVHDIVQNSTVGVSTDISLTVRRSNSDSALAALQQISRPSEVAIEMKKRVSAFAVYGASFKTDPSVAVRLTDVFMRLEANIELISSSPSRLMVIVNNDRVERLRSALEQEFSMACQLANVLP